MTEFKLTGLNGANPLGFLAALGTLQACTSLYGQGHCRLSWQDEGAGWHPVLSLDEMVDQRQWLEQLEGYLAQGNDFTALKGHDDLNLPVEDFRALLVSEVERAGSGQRGVLDLLAACGSEVVQAKLNGKDNGKMADTALRTMSGAGHQHFLGVMQTLIQDTNKSHLEKALVREWQYDDPIQNHSLRWDPQDDVRYALRWRNSSGDPERQRAGAMWGANRLAMEGFRLFFTAPVNDELETVGFQRKRRLGVFWTWPIWTGALTLPVVQSILALEALQAACPDRRVLAAMGVADVFQNQRITEGKFRNFTPARPV